MSPAAPLSATAAAEGSATGRVALVIPARNEGRLLPLVLRAIPPWVWRVILVDDASEDRTSEVMRAWNDPRARRLVSRKRLGVGGAILEGYREALGLGATCAVVVAADAQMDLAELPIVLGPIARGEADYVQGSRFRRGVPSGPMPATRVLGNRVLSAGASWAAGRPIADSQCGFTAASAPALRTLVACALPAGYGFPAFARLEMHRRGLRVAEVPVTALYGTEISEIHPLRDPPRILARILWRGMLRRIGRAAAPAEARGIASRVTARLRPGLASPHYEGRLATPHARGDLGQRRERAPGTALRAPLERRETRLLGPQPALGTSLPDRAGGPA